MAATPGDYLERALARHPDLLATMARIITPETYFQLYKSLADNYSPSLTVSHVQGPLVEAFFAQGAGGVSPARVDRSLRGSGTIGITVGQEPAPVWISAHGDICGYLTGEWDGSSYPLTPFCMTRARPGRRAAMALGINEGEGPLPQLAEGVMVTHDDGSTTFVCDVPDLPMWTQVVHHYPAVWNRDTDEIHGFLDNQAGAAAVMLAAKALTYTDTNAVFLLNDEEEGPVDTGNTGFSRACARLFHRTPTALLPSLYVSVDVQQQEDALEAGRPTMLGRGAIYTGHVSKARGAVTPPRLVGFLRGLAGALAGHGITLSENHERASRSDDVSAMFYTQNILHVGLPATYSHFDRTPTGLVGDMLHLARTLALLGLIAQDAEFRQHYLGV